ncbi:unnamed protein product, partial [Oppiella nova]
LDFKASMSLFDVDGYPFKIHNTTVNLATSKITVNWDPDGTAECKNPDGLKEINTYKQCISTTKLGKGGKKQADQLVAKGVDTCLNDMFKYFRKYNEFSQSDFTTL